MSARHLVTPDDRQLGEIFAGTVGEWSAGLDLPRYDALQKSVLGWPSAQGRYRYRALVDDAGAVLASLKAYRFAAQWDGRALVALGIGAVFTPPERRGCGHASELVERVMDEERRLGSTAAFLFSDIRPSFYERWGFMSVPSTQAEVRWQALPADEGARDVGEDELDRLAAALAARPVGAAFAVTRTAGTVQLLLGRLARTIEAHKVKLGPVGALVRGGAALWVGFPGRPLTILDFWAEDETAQRCLLARARASAERMHCPTLSVWAVGGATPFGTPHPRTQGLPMIAGMGASGPREAVLTGLDHF